MRSSKPSPFTSPAEETERPERSYARLARDLEAVRAVERREVEVRGEAPALAEHHVARAGLTVGWRPYAPMMRSAKPSPFTSPAAETEAAGVVACRLAGDLEAVRAVERGEIEVRAKPRACPNTT